MINNDHYCIIDTETTGLIPDKNAVIEIAFVILNNKLEEVDRYSAVNQVYDSRIIQQQALDVHGISMKEINAGITAKDSVKNINAIWSKYCKGRTKLVRVGHNIEFDDNMLENMFTTCGSDLHKYTYRNPQCTMKMSHMAWGYNDSQENFKLPTCCERIGVSIADSHRALGDVLSTVELFRHHVLNLRNTPQGIVKAEIGDEYSRSHTFRF